MAELTRKQRVFIEEFLTSWNATRAAAGAGYKHPQQQGSRLLSNVVVDEAIQQRIKEKAMGADECLARLAEQARCTIADFWRLSGGIDQEAIQAKGHLIKSITPTQLGLKIELHDAQTALIQIGKAHRLFTDNFDLTSGGEKVSIDDERFDRTISTLADALREAVSGKGPGTKGAVDPAEQAAMDGASVEGR